MQRKKGFYSPVWVWLGLHILLLKRIPWLYGNTAEGFSFPIAFLNSSRLSQPSPSLLDAGAYIPVWTDDENILVSFLGAEFVSGILYPNMHIIANSDIDATFNFILSATMFDRFIYQIDTVNHMLNIEVPDKESTIRNLRIENKDGKQFVLCSGIH